MQPALSLPSSLIGLDLEGLARAAIEAGAPEAQAPMRARQIRHWLYRQGVSSFEAMRNLPEPLRHGLADRYSIARPETVTRQESTDGTIKWLLRFADGNEVESVFIPETDRGALCISTQVGCSLTCSFCHTGTMPLVRNLGPGEILAQVLVARDVLGDWPTPAGGRRLTNLVVMGMGEPLLNYDNLVRALAIALDSDGIDLSKRRITVSTSGVVPRMRSLGEALGVGLAVSLHAVRDDLRDELVPINRKWPIAELLEACRSYPGRGRLITFEYVMLRGVNDSDADARELVRLLRGMPAKINLIPFNPWPGAPYACSTRARIEAFAGIVDAAGFAAPVRRPRGRDILAACGQLKTASQRLRRRAAA